MKVIQFDKWDENRIQEFIKLKAELQGHLPTFFPETIDDYKRVLHSDSPFVFDYEWVGFLIYENEKAIGKCLLSWRKGSKIGNLGFIDWVNNINVARMLISEVETKAKASGILEIKTPVDMNFFIKYRIKKPGGGHPLFGEPLYPDYYHDLFEKTGYDVIGTWDTYKVRRANIIRNYMHKRKQLKAARLPHDENLKVRSIRLSDWDNEIRIVHDLFERSFGEMPEFEPISFEQFKVVYDDFKYIIHPWYSMIVELNGSPVGFSINYPDPLPVLKHIKGKKLSALGKVILLIKLRTNFRSLMMAYVGKVPGPNGEDIKGIQIKTSKQLTNRAFFFGKGLVCYQSADSPSRRSINPESIEPFSQYVLYGKKLK